MTEHGLAKVGKGAMVHCKCGATFDTYGNQGSLNKLADHCANNGQPIHILTEIARMPRNQRVKGE